jgi:hypothetical protein
MLASAVRRIVITAHTQRPTMVLLIISCGESPRRHRACPVLPAATYYCWQQAGLSASALSPSSLGRGG